MATVLLAESKPGERAFFGEALRAAGHTVLCAEAGGEASPPAPRADVVVADVERAMARRWIGPGATPPHGALVLTSAFDALLAPWRASHATLVLPVASAEILAAIDDPTPRAGTSGTPFDWAARDDRLKETGIESSHMDPALSRIAQLVARSTGTEMALVTVVGSREQRYLGQSGLPDDLAIQGGVPRAWSLCQHVVAADAPLVVADATAHPGLSDNPFVEARLIRAYAGVPVRLEGVGAVGTVCVASDTPRDFSDQEIASLELAARLVEERLALTSARPVTALSQPAAAPPPPAEELRGAAAPPVAGGSQDGPMVTTLNVAPRASVVELSPSELILLPPSEGAPAAGQHAGPRRAPPPAGQLVGSLLDGKYWVTAHLGGGGMSEVYLARDRVLGSLVAIKVLLDYLQDDLLLREAQMLAAIRHPSIVQVHGWGSLGEGGRGRMYLVLEYVRGVELLQKLNAASARGGGFAPADALRILRNLAGALDSMHGVGLVHGDIKPGNILLDEAFDRAVIIDFGLAMRLPEPGAPYSPPAHIGGTPGYSAPEQLAPSASFAPSPRQDVYSLGAIAYALLVGTGPFSHLSMAERFLMQRRALFEPASRVVPGLPAAVDVVLGLALAADPAKRQSTPSELVDALAAALGGTPVAARRRAATLPLSRAGIFTMVRDTVAARVGEERALRLLARLDPTERRAFAPGAHPDDYYPTHALVAYLRAFAGGDRAQLESVGQSLGASSLPAVLRALEIGRSPYTFLRAVAPLHQRFHGWGRFEFSQTTTSSAAVQLEMDRALAPEMCALIGGTIRALVTLVAGSATVEHVKCVAAGAAACELKVTWPR